MILLFSLILASQTPNFTLSDLNGKEVFLDSLVKEGIVVIDFWATWCRPCIKELDSFKELQKKFENAVFVGINEDSPRTSSRVRSMVKARKWDFLILLDKNQKVSKLFHVLAIPHTIIINQRREIVYRHIGFRKDDEKILDKKLEALLTQKPNAKPENLKAQ